MWRTRPHRFAGPVVLQLLMANWSPSRNIHRTPVSPTLSSHGQKAKSFPAGKPRNPPKEAVGNLNWNRGSQSLLTMHTVRSGCCNARRGIASRIHENSPIPSSVPDAAQLLARPCRVGTDPFNLLKSCVNFPFSYTPCCGLEWHLPFEG